MKRYVSDQSGMKVYDGTSLEKSESMDKSITQYGGDADLKWLHGCRLWVDKDDVVLRGPEPMIGRKYSDLANLTYADVFTVERSIMRTLGERTKSHNPDDEDSKILIKSMMDEINQYIDKAIENGKTDKYNKDPLYQ